MEDRILIEQYKSDGDLVHLAKLYNKYMHLVYGACLKYLKNEADAEDAVMDVYEKLAKKIPKSVVMCGG